MDRNTAKLLVVSAFIAFGTCVFLSDSKTTRAQTDAFKPAGDIFQVIADYTSWKQVSKPDEVVSTDKQTVIDPSKINLTGTFSVISPGDVGI